MRRTTVAVSLLSFLGVVAGCAYFNGLYNANQLVEAAARAEREGRIGEARSLWSQVAVKAESVVVRYPNSKYHDDALVLQGRAMSNVGRCQDAVEPLQAALDTSPDTTLKQQANILLGRCLFLLGESDQAIGVLNNAVLSSDSLVSNAARLWRGRAFASIGSHAAAALDFEAVDHAEGDFDLAIAYARLSRNSEATIVLESLVRPPYQEDRWLAVLDTIGRLEQSVASEAVDALITRLDLEGDEKGRLLLSDGIRWTELGDSAKGLSRYDQVLEAAPGSVASASAQMRWVMSELREEGDLERLFELRDSLVAVEPIRGPDRESIVQLAELLSSVLASIDTPPDESDTSPLAIWRRNHPDFDMFLSAESLRDEIHADNLSKALFLRTVEVYPDSPIAPKALLAAASLDPTSTDSLRSVVRSTYPNSPYVLVLDGLGSSFDAGSSASPDSAASAVSAASAASAAYFALEDSLRTLLDTRGYH